MGYPTRGWRSSLRRSDGDAGRVSAAALSAHSRRRRARQQERRPECRRVRLRPRRRRRRRRGGADRRRTESGTLGLPSASPYGSHVSPVREDQYQCTRTSARTVYAKLNTKIMFNANYNNDK